MEVIIRPAQVSDAQGLSDLYSQTEGATRNPTAPKLFTKTLD